MTLRDKIAHAFRRFGFGATPAELDECEKLGLETTLKRLIDFDNILDTFRVDPQEFVWRPKEDPDTGAWRYRCWWILRMMATPRPLEEKLTLFWHSHFAVADSKVEDGPMMLGYLQTLHQHAGGKFADLLTAVAKNPAMMKYLDMEISMRGHPNENFAREVMELFTLGIGNYTEQDVKEVSRALTGWGFIQIYWQLPGTADTKLRDSIKYGRPFTSFAYLPAMHDPDPKKILGKTARWDGEGVLAMLATHPATAHRIAKRLWEFFAYSDPEPAVVQRIAAAFSKSNGDIKQTVWAIARSPEFWGDKCVRKLTKSPADFCIGVARQMGVPHALMALRQPDATPYSGIPQKILDNCGYISYRMDRMGLSLLYPPDVSGWKWDTAWASPAAMAERYQFQGMLTWGQKGPDEGALTCWKYVQSQKPKDSKGMAIAMAKLFDTELPEAALDLLAKVVDRHGGQKGTETANGFTGCLTDCLRFLVAAPQMHVC